LIGFSSFDGSSPLADSDMLVKYSYADANLDGEIGGTDYSRIDNAYLQTYGQVGQRRLQ
jgi:hypothetical protein